MKFLPASTILRLVTVRSFKSKAGKDLAFVKLADTSTFESEEFLLSRNTDVKILSAGQNYEVVLNVEGKYVSADLYELK